MTRERSGAGLATAFLAICWILSALMTAVMLLLLAQPFAIPECASYDRSGQRVARVGAAMIAIAFVALWIGASVLVRRDRGSTPSGRTALAVALPVSLIFTFVAGAGLMDAAIDQVADSADHAMCW